MYFKKRKHSQSKTRMFNTHVSFERAFPGTHVTRRMRREPGISCISCLQLPLKEAMAETRASLFLGRTNRFLNSYLRVHVTVSTTRLSPSLPRPRLPPVRCKSVRNLAGTRALAGDAPVMRFQAGGLEPNGDGQPASHLLTKDFSPLCVAYSCGGSPVLGGSRLCRRSGWDVSEPPVPPHYLLVHFHLSDPCVINAL